MTYHQKMGLGVFVIVIALLLAATFVFMKYRGASASEIETRGDVAWQTSLSEDFNKDGKKETVTLTSYSKDNKYKSYISTNQSIISKREKELIGFEEDLAFCRVKDFYQGNDSILCVFGEVGAHSQNIQMIKWSDFSFLKFIDQKGAAHQNIACDVPNFDFSYSTDNKLRIYFDNRDYDKDPLVDIIRSHYYLVNSSFHYDGVERIGNEGLIK